MKVRILGPNLYDQTKGQFHVHSKDCGDAKHYGPGRKYGGDADYGWVVDVDSRVEVVECVYSHQLDENPEVKPEDWLYDFHFAPCVKDLP
jgi:hypothetical protein